ncbi:MAG: ATP-binding protein [Methanosarcinaceae archaeon]|nr:ATP-binding protein [Methanosarcinaceae archaeon]
MNDVEPDKILNLLYEYNPWWRGKEIQIPEYRTKWFDSLVSELDDQKIEIIYGPRQVGKTVLMKQIVRHLIDNRNISPHNIMYLSMDHTSINLLCPEPIKDVVDVYSNYIKPSEFERAYIFLDEIQTIENWSSYLKQFYDLQYPVKFIVSGSSSTEIEKGGSESLVGRSRLRLMLQWKFADFVNFSLFREQRDGSLYNVPETAWFEDAVFKRNANTLFAAFEMYRETLLKNDIDLGKYIMEYLIKGGYPALADADYESARDMLMERFGLTIHKDIMRIFAIRNIKGLENIVLRCAMQSGQVTDYHGFAKSVGIKYDTFMAYLGYLMDVFLVSESRFYSKSDSTFKKGKKLYLRDHPTRNVLIGLLNRRLFEFGEEIGKTVETVVHDHSSRLAYRLEGHLQGNYWKGKKEVDIVIRLGTISIPIEVKYQEHPDDIGGLKECMQEFDSPFGIVVTKDTFKLKSNILFVPLHLFLAVC